MAHCCENVELFAGHCASCPHCHVRKTVASFCDIGQITVESLAGQMPVRSVQPKAFGFSGPAGALIESVSKARIEFFHFSRQEQGALPAGSVRV